MVFAAGLQIGKYELLRQLGQGGFGMVYLAHDHGLDRDCALKFLLPEHTTKPEILQRFLAEARAAAKINHLGIVTVFECGQVTNTGTQADGMAFIAMELLKGESLTDRLQHVGALPPELAVTLARQIASALHAAHSIGIVHRDLKPDNVFLVPDPESAIGERVKVLDFGIAKLAEAPASGVHTHSLMIFGTPRYMSPEQCRSSTNVDARSDIYALGVMLFEMLCGERPFDGEPGALIAYHQVVPPPTVRSKRPEIAVDLDGLVTAMLAKAPEDRPSSMDEVVRRLEPLRTSTSRPAVQPAAAPPARPIFDPLQPTVSSEPPRRSDAPARPIVDPLQVAVTNEPRRISVPTATLPSSPPAKRRKTWLVVGSGIVVTGVVLAVVAIQLRSGTKLPTSTPADASVPTEVTVTLFGGRQIKIPTEAKPVPGKEGQHVYRLPWDSTLIVHDIDQSSYGGCPDALKKSEERWKAENVERRLIRVDKSELRTEQGRVLLYAEMGSRNAEEADRGGEFHPMRSVSLCYGDHMVGVSVSARGVLTDQDDALFRSMMAALLR
jgi:serine/threonine protein kinase